ncbi:MAG: hypothetical protein ACI9J3_001691 [Parvicellaceae bacterium]|jgi:hypothetical protein
MKPFLSFRSLRRNLNDFDCHLDFSHSFEMTKRKKNYGKSKRNN